jgi:hypothetical protein
MLVDFEWRVVRIDFPFKIDEASVDNKVEIPIPAHCYSRTEVLKWFQTYQFGIILNHEPFFDGKEVPTTVMRKIEKQRVQVDGENFIDDFGFYVYFMVTEEPGLKDLRYD